MDSDLESVFHAALQEAQGDLVRAIRTLLMTAYDRGSSDNISVVVAKMHPEPVPASHARLSVGRDDNL